MKDIKQIIRAIKKADNVLISGHFAPDGDCIASMIGAAELVKALGKKYWLVNDGPFDRPEIKQYEALMTKELPKDFEKNTLGLIVDCSSPDRTGTKETLFNNLETAVIDHHSSGKPFGKYRYIDSNSPSTTLLIKRVFNECRIKINKETSRILFMGFATDSGFYKFLKENCQDYVKDSADLIKTGEINPSEIYSKINNCKAEESVKLLGLYINRMETFLDGKVIISYEEENDPDGPGASDSFYMQALSIGKTDVVVLLKNSKKIQGATEIGLRAAFDSKIDVGKTAGKLGGGGHAKAAGCTVEKTKDECRKIILDLLNEQYN